jgi:methanogenic corrinoid protein MtbC1
LTLDNNILGKNITEEYYRRNPKALEFHGDKGTEACKYDIKNILKYLQQVSIMDDPESYQQYISWNKTLFKNLNIPQRELLETPMLMHEYLQEELGMREILQLIIEEYDSIKVESPPDESEDENSKIAREYLDLLLDGEREKAYNLIMDQYNSKRKISEIYVDIIQQVQYRVGYIRQTNEITVAQEQYITQATRYLINRLYENVQPSRKGRGKIVATCIPGEQHDMGIQLLSDLLGLDGWDVIYPDPSTPADSVDDTVRREEPDLLALSVTVLTNLYNAQLLIEQVRENFPDVKIITGGYSYLKNRGLCKKIKSYGYVEKALNSVRLVESLVR